RCLAGRNTLDRGLDERRLDLLDQPVVARQAEQEIHPIRLAPSHQRLSGEAGIRTQQDPYPWPALADLRNNARNLLHRSGGGVDVRPAKLGGEQVAAAEHVKRQVAEAVVIAVEEPALLVAVQRIVGGVEVEDDLLRGAAMCVEKQIDEQRLDAGAVVTDPVIPRWLRLAQLQPVQRALAGERRAV